MNIPVQSEEQQEYTQEMQKHIIDLIDLFTKIDTAWKSAGYKGNPIAALNMAVSGICIYGKALQESQNAIA